MKEKSVASDRGISRGRVGMAIMGREHQKLESEEGGPKDRVD